MNKNIRYSLIIAIKIILSLFVFLIFSGFKIFSHVMGGGFIFDMIIILGLVGVLSKIYKYEPKKRN